MAQELVGFRCAVTSVADIMRCCARAYGVMLVGHISSQTVGQAIEEGGLAAKMQVGEIVHQLDGESTYHFVRIPILRLGTYEPLGIMLSMDGTKECILWPIKFLAMAWDT